MSNPMIVAGQKKKKKWPKPTNVLIGSGSFRVVFSGRLYFSSFWRWTISVSSKLEGPNPLQTFLPHFPGKVTVKQVRVFYFKKLSVRQQAGSCALCLNTTGIRFFFLALVSIRLYTYLSCWFRPLRPRGNSPPAISTPWTAPFRSRCVLRPRGASLTHRGTVRSCIHVCVCHLSFSFFPSKSTSWNLELF